MRMHVHENVKQINETICFWESRNYEVTDNVLGDYAPKIGIRSIEESAIIRSNKWKKMKSATSTPACTCMHVHLQVFCAPSQMEALPFHFLSTPYRCRGERTMRAIFCPAGDWGIVLTPKIGVSELILYFSKEVFFSELIRSEIIFILIYLIG